MNCRELLYDNIPKICNLEVDLSKNMLAQFSFNPSLISGSKGFVDIASVNYLQILPEGEKGKFNLAIYEEIYTEENNDWKEFNRLIYSLGKMNRLSEQIFDKVKDIVKCYCYYTCLRQLLEKKSDCRQNKDYRKQEFHKLTFANLKNILSCILKIDDSFYEIEGLKSKEGRKNFSKIFNEYIVRRDYYTHGILYLFLPQKEAVLKIQKEAEVKYIKYQKEDFEVNLKMFLFLNTILCDIRLIIQNKECPTLSVSQHLCDLCFNKKSNQKTVL